MGALTKVIKRGAPAFAPSSRPSVAAPQPAAPPSAAMPRKRIIEREVVGATQEAAEIRRRAEHEAQRIVDEANEQAYEIRQNGFEEGKQEALAQYTGQITTALMQVRRIEQELEPLYIGLIRDCVEKLIGQEMKLHPDAIVGVVRGALADARQQREVIVRVHPTDAEALQRNKNRLLEALARANTVEIREDATVTRGGCVVVTELGTIDASLERQLDALAAVLEAELGESGLVSGEGEYDELDPEDDPGAGY